MLATMSAPKSSDAARFAWTALALAARGGIAGDHDALARLHAAVLGLCDAEFDCSGVCPLSKDGRCAER